MNIDDNFENIMESKDSVELDKSFAMNNNNNEVLNNFAMNNSNNNECLNNFAMNINNNNNECLNNFAMNNDNNNECLNNLAMNNNNNNECLNNLDDGVSYEKVSAFNYYNGIEESNETGGSCCSQILEDFFDLKKGMDDSVSPDVLKENFGSSGLYN
jgi:hypothetical protein